MASFSSIVPATAQPEAVPAGPPTVRPRVMKLVFDFPPFNVYHSMYQVVSKCRDQYEFDFDWLFVSSDPAEEKKEASR